MLPFRPFGRHRKMQGINMLGQSVESSWTDMKAHLFQSQFQVFSAFAFIGDKKYISRPDVIIECFGQKKLFDDSSITKINTYHDSLKPRRGTYVVSKEPVAERVHEGEPADIQYITVGFDQLKLEPIANLFAGK